jgi:cytochrome c oxidase assembly factor CtaG
VSWLLQPDVVASLVALALYGVGSRKRLRLVGAAPPQWRRRSACFVAGLASLVFVLSPVFERWAAELLAAHMLQHVVLLAVAPPLIVLGAPWIPVWRGLPLALRRPLALGVMAYPRAVRAAFRTLRSPVPVWLLVNANLAVWHWPSVYDLTLRNPAVHVLEHSLFLTLGLLFWLQVLDSPPLHPRLQGLWRVGYTTAASAAGWLLAVVLAFDPSPLYGAYAAVQHRPGGLSALADQDLAAGVMLGIGSVPYAIAVFVGIYQWLDEERPRRSRRRVTAAA